ncbi:hypothetical protein V8G54_009681 [Vigna mungo]|uniref:Uncharacterized protein n=1 Tax=Vigna mungo TaxID=3915 RepID=A0AAQ3S5Q6_VIGMU
MNLMALIVLSSMMNTVMSFLRVFLKNMLPSFLSIESTFETPPITEVKSFLLAHESSSNCFQRKLFPPSENYSQSCENPSSRLKYAVPQFKEILITQPSLIRLLVTGVVVVVATDLTTQC